MIQCMTLHALETIYTTVPWLYRQHSLLLKTLKKAFLEVHVHNQNFCVA